MHKVASAVSITPKQNESSYRTLEKIQKRNRPKSEYSSNTTMRKHKKQSTGLSIHRVNERSEVDEVIDLPSNGTIR